MSETVGFIGLGIMGRGMAHNLLKAGFDLRDAFPEGNLAPALEGFAGRRYLGLQDVTRVKLDSGDDRHFFWGLGLA